MKTADLSKLRTSWTRFSIVHAVELITQGDLEQLLNGQVDKPVLESFLGTNDLNDIPAYWRQVIKYKNTRGYFAIIAAILTHIDIITDFKEIYSNGNAGGVFYYNKPRQGKNSNRKIQTNIRSVLVTGGAAKTTLRRSKIVEYDFSPLYREGVLGACFKELLKNRLKVLGFMENEIEKDIITISSSLGIIEAIGLTEEQLEKWIQGYSLEKIKDLAPIKESSTIPSPPIEGLDHFSKISTKRINSKFSSYLFKNDKKSRKQEYLDEGWTLAKALKTTNKYQKAKVHSEAFEDKVWAVFAKAGFKWLNNSRNFKLKHSDNNKIPEKQIDVFALDDDCALIIECKSAENRKKRSFQKDINEIGQLIPKIEKNIYKVLNRKIQVAWIFATNNYVLSDNDKARLKEFGVFHMNQDEIDYWWLLAKNLEHATKYQIFGKLFAHSPIPALSYKVPAIKGFMGENTYYSFSVEPEVLLKIGFVLHRTDSSRQAFESYQRMVKGSRIKAINKYIIEDEGYFPNSVILNLLTVDLEGKSLGLQFQPLTDQNHDSSTELGILTLPSRYRTAFIIDGQHRIFGYGKTQNKYSDQIPVIAFEDLPAEEQTKIFIDINHKQKSVPKNLLRTLMSEFNWGSSSPDEAFDALKTRIIQRLNDDENSPLFRRIITAEESKTKLRCITLEYLLKNGINPSMFFGIVQKRKLIKTGYLWTGDYDETLNKSLDFFFLCLGFLETNCSNQWNIGSGEGGFISMNVGISSYFRLLDDLIRHESILGFSPYNCSAKQLFLRLKPYLIPVSNFINNLTPSEIKNLRGSLGSGGVKKVLPEFKYAIHKEFSEYNPPGLTQWIKDSSGQFNPLAKQLGDKIQLALRDFVFRKLREMYGEKDERWWIEGVNKDIRKYCSGTAIDQGNKEPDYNYLLTIHYQKIIIDNKELLLSFFTPPKMDNVKNIKKLGWIEKLNRVRQKFSHPEREKVTEQEYEMIVEISEWLLPRIS